MERVKEYALTAFNSMRANVNRWNKNIGDGERSISRIFYDQVFSSGEKPSGLSTVPKIDQANEKMCHDHYLKPQSVAKFIMDTKFHLEDFDSFFQIFEMCRSTHFITKKQNEILKKSTKNGTILTKYTYTENKFILYKENVLVDNHPILEVPEYYSDWEIKYRENGFTALCSPKITLDNFL